MIYGILLLYYQDYVDQAVAKFDVLLNLAGNGKYKIVIVINNPSLVLTKDPEYIYCDGDNSMWEFSGWDCGIKKIQEQYQPSDLLVFANDTFCHHRPWNSSDTARFASCFCRMLAEKKRGIAGEINTFGESFFIQGIRSRAWVSTYLFGIDGATFNAIGEHVTQFKHEASIISISQTKRAFTVPSEIASSNLQRHLNRWIFPSRHGVGWYKSATAPLSLIRMKILAIFNEKMLTAVCLDNGGFLISANKSWPSKFLNRLKILLGKLY